MALLFPSSRKPRQFDYKPRFYNPEKEAREERRKELCGPTVEEVGSENYVPGQFIKQNMSARRGISRRTKKNKSSRTMLVIAFLVAAGLVFLLKFVLK